MSDDRRIPATDRCHDGAEPSTPRPALPVAPVPRPRRPDWRQGGDPVAGVHGGLLGVLLLVPAVGAVAVAGAVRVVPALPVGGVLGALLVALVVVTAVRIRPPGLLRFRAEDVLVALVIGTALRLCHGWFVIAETGESALPSAGALDGGSTASAVGAVVAAAVVAPVVEEAFFRGALFVAVHEVVRRTAGAAMAASAAVVVSTALFVLLHAAVPGVPPASLAAIALVGAACGTATVATGRIWPAIGIHAVYNASWSLLLAIGSATA